LQAWIAGHPFIFWAAFAVCIWCGVCWILSLSSGWALLAREYRHHGEFDGPRWWFQHGKVGLVDIRGGLIVGANTNGLYLGMITLFRPGHPPLLIPWSDTSVPRDRSFFLPQMGFQIGTSPAISFSVPAQLAEQIVKAAERGAKSAPIG
jgi:hypothetical protein